MTQPLEITLDKENLGTGEPEECACYGLLSILAQDACLTGGIDHHTQEYRLGPLVSGYYLAQWLAWHWWRHRWEPRRQDDGWELAHCMTAIGEGYVWPDITILSDGHRMALVSQPSTDADAIPFRYTNNRAISLPAPEWEQVVDRFFGRIIDQLDADSLKDTNLHLLLGELQAERSNPELARWRRIEALLGQDPNTLDDSRMKQLVAESEHFGVNAVDEMAAHAGLQSNGDSAWLSADELTKYAHKKGYSASLQNSISVEPLSRNTKNPAWQWGVAMAKKLRRQEHLHDTPISNQKLADMAGVGHESLKDSSETTPYPAFSLAEATGKDRIILRAKRSSGRRFDLARLLADQWFEPEDKLHPATFTRTYRQKAQRAFAAELLSPASAVIEMLDGHYEDEDKREDVAEHFNVSAMVIENLLVDHMLPRDELDSLNIDDRAA